jgi:hypothetical protein
MTGARRFDSGAERDRVVATLRRELLVPFDDEVAASHLEAMLLEFDWKLDPEPDAEPVHRRPMLRVRTVRASCIAAATLMVTGGFAAAGALPAPAQHWLSRATRVVGIRLPDSPAPSPAPRTNTPRTNTPRITTPSARTPPQPSQAGPAARPGGRAAETTPPSKPRPRPVPAVKPGPTPPLAPAAGPENEPGNARSSEAKAKNNAGGNGNAKSEAKSSDAAAGAEKGKATPPDQAKKSLKSEKSEKG